MNSFSRREAIAVVPIALAGCLRLEEADSGQADDTDGGDDADDGGEVDVEESDGGTTEDAEEDEAAWPTWTFGPDEDLETEPAYDDGTVFVGSLDEVFAVDAATGDLEWRSEGIGQNRTHVPLMPTEERVFAHGNWGTAAYDRDSGEQLWESEFDGQVRPLLGDEQLYLWDTSEGVGGNDTVAALDPETGEIEWTVQDETHFGRHGTSSPELTNDILCVGSDHGRVHGIDVTAGERVWLHEGDEDTHVTSIAAYEGTFVVAFGTGPVKAFDAEQGEILWTEFDGDESLGRMARADASITPIDDRLIISHERLVAIDPETGTIEWENPNAGRSRPPVFDGETVYVQTRLDNESVLGTLDTDTGAITDTHRINDGESGFLGRPASGDDRVYTLFQSDAELWAFDFEHPPSENG